MSKLLITHMEIKGESCLVSAVLDQQQVIQLNLYPAKRKELLGNIYVGRVDRIVDNIQAAFVKIQDLVCYLPLSDLKSPVYAMSKKNDRLCAGDEILVQISREAIKTKAPSVTTNLNITGKYLVLTTEKGEVGISSKLDKNTRKRLKEWILEGNIADCGVIVRTNAAEVSKEDIMAELQYLKGRMDQIIHYGPSRVSGSLLYQTEAGYLQAVRDIRYQELEEIVTDSEEVYQEIKEYLTLLEHPVITKLRLYHDALLSMNKLYRLESVLEEACKTHIWLPSGGSLVIQRTEACTVIDVNTGKFTGKKSIDETFYKINQEAAKEIAYQLRLRNISGIILIDFINMKDSKKEEELMQLLQRHCKADPVQTNVVDMTALKIVEVTRKKVRKSLAEEIAEIAQ